MYRNGIKIALDFVAALFGLVLLFPLFLLVAVALMIANQGSCFFFQKRPGKDEKIFQIIKFKTMNDRRDASGNLLPDVERITKIGGFVRKYSLDEIPQLLNVLKGDMSLVGPRPLIPEYLPMYNDDQKRRHNVRPGITGWAQVNGRNAISWTKKFELDVWYVDNLNFLLDVKILLKTLQKVVASEDVNLSEATTSEYFNGTN